MNRSSFPYGPASRVAVPLLFLAALSLFSGCEAKFGYKKGKSVYFSQAKRVTIVETVSASGQVQPVDEVKISPEVSGEIVALLVEEGDTVAQGQLLAKTRPDNLQSAYERVVASLNSQRANLMQVKANAASSKAQFVQAKLQYDRQKELFDKEVISKQDFEAAEANFESSKANYEAAQESVRAAEYNVQSAEATVNDAKETLSLTEIYAPMSGVITSLSVEQGETVVGTQQMSGTEMMRIANLSAMEVRVDVNENDIIRVNKGDTAIIEVDSYAYMEKTFSGIVTDIAQSANVSTSETVTEFEVKILILEDSYQDLLKPGQVSPFLPGMTASVEIVTDRRQNVLSVPVSAVTVRKKDEAADRRRRQSQKDGGDAPAEDLVEVVFVKAESDTVRRAVVKTGISDFDNIEVLSGIEEGETVVDGPYNMVSKRLKEGDQVKEKKERGRDKGND